MCDYYTFACRFQCLPETHHFPPNWISYIVAYIWLITNDGIPSHYEHRVNYSKKFIFISILTYIMILERRSLQKKKRSKNPPSTDLFFVLIIREKCIFLLLNSSNSHHCQNSSCAASLILLEKCYQT